LRFSHVIGQSRTKAFLQQLHQGGRVPHALLLLGPTGSGSLALALAMAQLLQCEKASGEADMFGASEPLTEPCGQCGACRKAQQFIHPDIHFSYPVVKKKDDRPAVSTDYAAEWRTALNTNPYLDVNQWLQSINAENKQGNINKDECNAIIKKLSLKVFEGRYKILLMWLPEHLGNEGNRLLKLIEEPPEQTVFLLVAEAQDRILNTILSRCQLVKTDPLSDDEVVDGLKRLRGLDEQRCRQLAFLADGNLNAALAMADNPEVDDSHMLIDWMRKCYRGFGPDLVKCTEDFAKLGRENQKQFLHYSLYFLREIMGFVVKSYTPPRLRQEEMQPAQNMAKLLGFDQVDRMAKLLNNNIYHIERNANPKVLFLDTSIKMNRIFKNN